MQLATLSWKGGLETFPCTPEFQQYKLSFCPILSQPDVFDRLYTDPRPIDLPSLGCLNPTLN